MKKFFKYLGLTILILILLIIGLTIKSDFDLKETSEKYKPYIQETITKLATWDKKTYKDLMSKKTYNQMNDEQWSLFLKKLSSLGKLQSIESSEIKFSLSTAGTNGSYEINTFLIFAKFENDVAYITIKIKDDNNKKELTSIFFNSDILLK